MKGPPHNPHLLKVPLYIAGKAAEEVRESLGLDEVVKLASNENPLGPSPMAVAALKEALSKANLYPGIAERELCRSLVDFHGGGLTEAHFLIGNGATDVLRMIAQGFIFGKAQAVMPRVSFPMYPILTTMFGSDPIAVEPAPDYGIDLEAMLDSLTEHTRVVWLCSPNNPTGLILTQRVVEAFVKRIPDHCVVVLDESYRDFVTDPDTVDGVDLVRAGLPVIAVRSFSKSAGLANLRVGYAVADPATIEYLLHAKLPFNTGAPVLLAAKASLEDVEYRRRSRSFIVHERAVVYQMLVEAGLESMPSQANFLLALHVPGGGKLLAERLMEQGIIVRPMGPFGLPDSVRFSVGRSEQNLLVADALAKVLPRIRALSHG